MVERATVNHEVDGSTPPAHPSEATMNIFFAVLFLFFYEPHVVASPEHFSLDVVSQNGDSSFVSPESGVATLFQDASWYGVLGFLAHDWASGSSFYEMGIDDWIWVIYPDGAVSYRVTETLDYTYAGPDVLYSPGGEIVTYPQAFDQIYRKPGRVVLQTCRGQGFWFVIAE